MCCCKFWVMSWFAFGTLCVSTVGCVGTLEPVGQSPHHGWHRVEVHPTEEPMIHWQVPVTIP